MKTEVNVFIRHLLLLFLLAVNCVGMLASSTDLNAGRPDRPQRLIFIHHSTGENWLSDDNGGLGIALSDNNYFVSDTYYGWGPDSIGDSTDIGNWYQWFRGPSAVKYLNELYAESEQISAYSRLDDPDDKGENTIVMFKSCFPNSELKGAPSDPVPSIDDNPLRGQSYDSGSHTVANAKGIYIDLLNYFKERQDKLFVVITAPPLSDASYAANARAFNQWLYREWLANYTYKNVAVFDFYNVLTTNGGNPDVNDLDSETGNHHRYFDGVIQHKIDGDRDSQPNISEYPSGDGDDHPSQAGNLKATGEFLPLLNIFWHCWKEDGACPETGGGGGGGETVPDPPTSLIATSKAANKIRVQWTWNSATFGDVAEFIVSRRVGSPTGEWNESYNTISDGSKSFDDNVAVRNPTTQLYSYKVRACNAAGCSEDTREAVVPFAPIQLSASAASVNSITLKWSPRAGSIQNGYTVYRKEGDCRGSRWKMVKEFKTASTTWVHSNAISGQTYSYKVQATNASGVTPNVFKGYSGFSRCVSASV